MCSSDRSSRSKHNGPKKNKNLAMATDRKVGKSVKKKQNEKKKRKMLNGKASDNYLILSICSCVLINFT